MEDFRESENRFRTIADTAPAFMFIIGKNAFAEYFNTTWLDFIGADFEKAKGWGWQDFTHPHDLPLISETYAEAFSKQKPYTFEVRHKAKDGAYHWILWNGQPRFLANGQFMGMMGIGVNITERKMAEAALRESEMQFRNFSNNITNLAWIADGKGWIFWYNQRWYDYTGSNLEEMQGWGWNKVHHPKHMEELIEFIKDAWQKGEPYELTFPLRRHDGEFRWFLTRVVPIRDANGDVHRWIGTNTDIHEQKLAEERFQTLAESLPHLVWMMDDKGDYDYVNGQWKRYSGLDPSATDTWRIMVHPDDMQAITQGWHHSLATGTSHFAEARLKSKAGEYRWHSVYGEPIRSEEKKIIRWIGAFTDIHDRKTLSEKLEKLVQERTRELTILNEMLRERNDDLANSENFLQQLIDSSVEFISVVDNSLHYIATNKTFEKGIGLTRDRLIGKHLLDINQEDGRTQQYESIQKALNGETVYLGKRKDLVNREYYLDTYYIPLVIQDKVKGVIMLSRDVTDIVRSEQLLEQKNRELQRSNDDLQQFAGVVSHDLKEPVRKIRIYGGFLKSEFVKELPESGRNYLDKIELATARMHDMIDSILSYSSVPAREEDFEWVNLNGLLHHIKDDLEVVIQMKNAVIQHDELPPVKGSPVLLHQLLYNLINNALKFSRTEVQPVVTLAAEQIESAAENEPYGQNGTRYIVISVQDNGIGFKQSEAALIFKPFSRLHSKSKYEGTGLGLALCAKIVDRHGGKIEAEGIEGQGATFRIYLLVE